MKAVEIIRPFSRNMATGLDATEVWYSYDEALNYARTSPVAYLGQVLVIINEALQKVYLYQICYDKTNEYKYSIENKQASASGPTTAFNLLGSVDDYRDLPQTGSYGDMYYSKRDARFYIAVERTTTGELTWIYLKLNVDYVSTVVDGILSSKTYRTFINNTGKPALYYNEGTNDPNANKWLKIDDNGTEANALVTTNAVKNIVSDLLSNFKPSAEFTDINNTTDINAFVSYMPIMLLKYKRNNGGDIKTATIYKSSDDVTYTQTGIQYVSERTSGTSVGGNLIQYNADTGERTIKFIDMVGFTPLPNTSTYYKIIIDTYPSDDNVVKAIRLEYKIVYTAHYPIYVGTNLNNSEVLYPSKSGEFDVTLSYNGDTENKIYQLYIDIPSDRQLTKVTYANMSDDDCLSLFINESNDENIVSPVTDIVKEHSDQTYTRYRYVLSSLNINELTSQLELAGYNTNSSEIHKIIEDQFPCFSGNGTYIFHIV